MKKIIEYLRDNIQNKAILLGLFSVFTAAIMGYFTYHYYVPTHVEALSHAGVFNHVTVLSYYGYTSIEQIGALEYLLQQAGTIKTGKTLKDIFPERSNKQEVLKDILAFIKITQNQFFLRTGTQERWEVNPAAWMQEVQDDEPKKQKVLGSFKVLGLIEDIVPIAKTVDALCILGSTMKKMGSRLANAEQLLKNNNIKAQHIILLSGERKVTSIKGGKMAINTASDGNEAQLLSLAKEYKLNIDQLTETHLIQKAYQVYQNSKASLIGKLKLHVIDTPAGDLPRPTTETTIIELLKQLKEKKEMKDIKNIIFISSQPDVHYQEAVINTILKQQDSNLKFEVIGAPQNAIDIKTVAGGFGSYIFAKTPSILRVLGINKIDDESLKNEFLYLYKKNPLVYKHIHKL